MMDAKQLADLFQTSDQIVRLCGCGRESSRRIARRAAAISTFSATRSSNGSLRAGTCPVRTVEEDARYATWTYARDRLPDDIACGCAVGLGLGLDC